MSCGEPCDGCIDRATHHLCDSCVSADIDRLTTDLLDARAKVERLREAVRQVHALAEKTMLDAWCVGIGRETLRDIHKITKGMVE